MVDRKLSVTHKRWPIAGEFRIARGAKAIADVIHVAIQEAGIAGRAECTPYPRYGETIDAVAKECQRLRPLHDLDLPWLPPFDNGFDLIATLDQTGSPFAFSAGAARNALDCALWDREAKRTGQPIWELAQLPAPEPRHTAFTLSLSDPHGMAASAMAHADKPILKMKLAGDDNDEHRVRAVRNAREDADLIVDANEGFDLNGLRSFVRTAADLGVALIEQPLNADDDDDLLGFDSPVPLCADESFHTSADMDEIAKRYQAVNIKLDKTGGLTEALRATRLAQERGLDIMVGCMVASSLAMAPAFYLTPFATYVDLDGPLLLDQDMDHGIRFDGSLMHPPSPKLWG